MVAVIDYSRPLATLLRESTHEAHDAVATSKGAKLLLSGTLAREEYVRYLMMLWHIYDAIERALDKHASHPVLEPTYNPTLLARAPALSADIAHLLDVDEGSWRTHPIYRELATPSLPDPLAAYVARIEELAGGGVDPSPLLAHAYVRYLGDLSGGQSMRHILAKAYGLDEAEGLGIEFYAFKELKSAKAAGLGEMKRIKEWYREGMTKGGEGRDVDVLASIVNETGTAFKLNAGLFETIRHITIEQAEAEANGKDLEEEEQVNGTESRVVYDGTKAESAGSYSISSVLAVIVAMCAAHFVLVVGGFTGNAGYQKLIAFEEWVAGVWKTTVN
ncbi:heme oxygenase-like protein [Coprinopsis marcescibilis]|uniref:Heme oxygenase-like protein n=1 Tax=Coprinopsis marcescibilis TaxID=230819 RepID=A0A5C3KX51_COPMA|nr:heme oxygenase-like protein [Coprinopsis marcescibilis]